jgi:hypothetical protein
MLQWEKKENDLKTFIAFLQSGEKFLSETLPTKTKIFSA